MSRKKLKAVDPTGETTGEKGKAARWFHLDFGLPELNKDAISALALVVAWMAQVGNIERFKTSDAATRRAMVAPIIARMVELGMEHTLDEVVSKVG